MTFFSKVALSVGLLYGANLVYHLGQQLHIESKERDAERNFSMRFNDAYYQRTMYHSGPNLQLIIDLHDIHRESLQKQHTLNEKRAVNPFYEVEVADFDPFE